MVAPLSDPCERPLAADAARAHRSPSRICCALAQAARVKPAVARLATAAQCSPVCRVVPPAMTVFDTAHEKRAGCGAPTHGAVGPGTRGRTEHHDPPREHFGTGTVAGCAGQSRQRRRAARVRTLHPDYARSFAGHGAGNMPGAAWLLSTLMLPGATVLMLRVTALPEAH
jgi:hypothetical protein